MVYSRVLFPIFLFSIGLPSVFSNLFFPVRNVRSSKVFSLSFVLLYVYQPSRQTLYFSPTSLCLKQAVWLPGCLAVWLVRWNFSFFQVVFRRFHFQFHWRVQPKPAWLDLIEWQREREKKEKNYPSIPVFRPSTVKWSRLNSITMWWRRISSFLPDNFSSSSLEREKGSLKEVIRNPSAVLRSRWQRRQY